MTTHVGNEGRDGGREGTLVLLLGSRLQQLLERDRDYGSSKWGITALCWNLWEASSSGFHNSKGSNQWKPVGVGFTFLMSAPLSWIECLIMHPSKGIDSTFRDTSSLILEIECTAFYGGWKTNAQKGTGTGTRWSDRKLKGQGAKSWLGQKGIIARDTDHGCTNA
ncbi:hypothetical protein AG1IA_09522 [Rhizoctonia solani AG-1 IA]|uniref:Uncharacterized protein n=1 Tax=Thanatephorus cucumeris (strain AG1-IA) TaxID=983506 RepID=L8WE44_THACA|nr:hypothetical protein AG1IA_09522 [Rhizoctonia solani AG-1 IA]